MSSSCELNPFSYGKIDGCGEVKANSGSTDRVHCRLLSGLQLLHVRERIMTFLVLCCVLILHEKSVSEIISYPVLDEPPFSELSHQGNVGHTSFSEAVVVASYRNRGVLEMNRRREYVGAA
jgi:hypothetical protein